MANTTTNAKPRGGRLDLRQARKTAGLSQQQLATIAGCSVASVAIFERGYQPEHSDVLPRLRAALIEPTTSNGAPPEDAVAKTAEVTGHVQRTD